MDNLIISVGRQLGSGGCDIAKKLAKAFDCKYYDHELINLAAKRSGFNPRIFEKQDESHGALKSLFGSFSGRLGRSTSNFYRNSMSQESLFQVQSEAIWKAAKEGNCVLVSRCADYILRTKPGLFSIFITADEEVRIKAVSERLNCDLDTARKFIRRKEAERADYYYYYTSRKWGAAENYNLCINSSLLGIDRTADIIEQIIRETKSL